jgi:hypothetical protein
MRLARTTGQVSSPGNDRSASALWWGRCSGSTRWNTASVLPSAIVATAARFESFTRVPFVSSLAKRFWSTRAQADTTAGRGWFGIGEFAGLARWGCRPACCVGVDAAFRRRAPRRSSHMACRGLRSRKVTAASSFVARQGYAGVAGGCGPCGSRRGVIGSTTFTEPLPRRFRWRC